jgi:hypothetical protein
VLPALLLAATVAAAPAPAAAQAPQLRRASLHQEAWEQDPWAEPEQDQRHPHLLLSLWGGEAFANGGSGRSSGFFRSLRSASQLWTPVVLTRFTQRFLTRHAVEAAFSLGLGAGKPSGWIAWYQVAIGMRVPLGPVFLAGELAFEQYDIIRLGGGFGFAF